MIRNTLSCILLSKFIGTGTNRLSDLDHGRICLQFYKSSILSRLLNKKMKIIKNDLKPKINIMRVSYCLLLLLEFRLSPVGPSGKI